jgi:hypothetical protein
MRPRISAPQFTYPEMKTTSCSQRRGSKGKRKSLHIITTGVIHIRVRNFFILVFNQLVALFNIVLIVCVWNFRLEILISMKFENSILNNTSFSPPDSKPTSSKGRLAARTSPLGTLHLHGFPQKSSRRNKIPSPTPTVTWSALT